MAPLVRPARDLLGVAYDLGMFSPTSVIAVMIRPWLWITAVGALFAFAKQDWWKHPPFLPIPDRRVMAWRVTTAYGRHDMTLVDEDLLSYLRWRRSTGASSSA